MSRTSTFICFKFKISLIIDSDIIHITQLGITQYQIRRNGADILFLHDLLNDLVNYPKLL